MNANNSLKKMWAIEEVGTWEGGGATEKPRSAAMERASDMPPMRLRGFFPTQVLPVSLPIDIFLQPKHGLLFLQKRLADISADWGRPIEILNYRRRQKLLLYCWLSLKLSDKSCYFEIINNFTIYHLFNSCPFSYYLLPCLSGEKRKKSFECSPKPSGA